MELARDRPGAQPRIVLITTGHSGLLAKLLASDRNLVGIVQNVRAKSLTAPTPPTHALRRMASAGFRWIERTPPSVSDLAIAHDVSYYYMDGGCDARLERWMRLTAPDVIVVCGMVELLKSNIYSIPPLGAVNLHPSLLPKYRGPDPLFWTYYDMDLEGGVTVHLVDDGADTGDILFQESIPIRPGMPRRELLDLAMGVIGPRLVFRAIDALARGDCPRIPQPRQSPTVRARRLEPGEQRRLIDWTGWPIERVWHLLKGTEPWLESLDPPPGWRTGLEWRVGPYAKEPSSAVPGAIARDAAGHYVAHPEGKIRLSPRYSAKGLGRTLLSWSGVRATRGRSSQPSGSH